MFRDGFLLELHHLKPLLVGEGFFFRVGGLDMIMKMVTILIWAATTKLHGGWDHPPQGKLSIQLYYVNEGYIYIYIYRH